MRLYHGILLLCFLSILASCNRKAGMNQAGSAENHKKAKNIILLIGDGMGMAQLSTPFIFSEQKPNISRFPVVGIHNPRSTSHKITDSAAGATAFATGQKSYNGAISVDQDTLPLKSILEEASHQGLKTGVISTSSITHATPACFYAHVPMRKMEEEIALQLTHSSVDFVAGGGKNFFFRRSDGSSLYSDLATQYVLDTSRIALSLPLEKSKRYAFLLADEGMPKMQEGRDRFLLDATKAALNYLSDADKGFFLMIEGSQIDWGGHANDADYIIEETKDFDEVIGAVLDFAERDEETLVIVTADHETGGFALSAAEVFKKRDYAHIAPSFSTGGHTASLIPVLSYGPGSHLFGGFMENSDIYHRMKAAHGLLSN